MLDVDLACLEAHLARLDVLIRREVRRWQLAGQDPTDRFRGLHVTDADADALSGRAPGTSWGQTVSLPPDEADAFAAAADQAAARAQALADQVHQCGGITRLEYLAAAFGLDSFDLDTLLIALAPALDGRYERLYGYLQDDITRRLPQVSLVLDLLNAPGLAHRLAALQHFTDEAPLFRHRLLQRVLTADPVPAGPLGDVLRVDPAVVSWLLGHYRPHEGLGEHAVLLWPDRDEADTLLAGAAWSAIEQTQTQEPPVLALYGPDRAAQEAAARRLAACQERLLLRVDLASVVAAGTPLLSAVRLALRDACLTGGIPFLLGWEACLDEGSVPSELLLAELYACPDVVIVAGRASWQAWGVERRRRLVWIELPSPDYERRHGLWTHYLTRAGLTPADEVISQLAGQFRLTTGQIRDAVALAEDLAAGRQGRSEAFVQGRSEGFVQAGVEELDLFAAARAHSSPGLAKLARKINLRFGWQDIILPGDQVAMLREIVSTVRHRAQVLERWGVGKKLASSAGVTVLFAGPPGTGKTMAAEVVARELGLDLFKIDLSTVISKYVGETEKNLEKIFCEAENSNAILFFDEADAIFGKRSEVKDAHDRYANVEVSYLLQRMEAYDGVTILATNLRANLDEAFTRRLQFVVDVPFPDKEYRLRIWQTLFPPDVPRAPQIDLGLLAERFRLAGGNIRNIIVSAAYLAAADGGQVTMDHLLHGVRRELQKMGRLVNEADMRIH